MMRETRSNVAFIRRQANRGATAGQIAVRCEERLTWDGPLPTTKDILRVLLKESLRVLASARAEAVPAVAGTAGTVGDCGEP